VFSKTYRGFTIGRYIVMGYNGFGYVRGVPDIEGKISDMF
jgi:hypothetical protein